MNTKFLLLIILSILIGKTRFQFEADGELLEYEQDGVRITKLTENVQVFNDSLSIETDQAYNYNELNKLFLYGNTKMISKTDTLTCDSMIYWLDKDSLFAFGNVQLTQEQQKLNAQKLSFWETDGYRGSSFIASKNVNIIGDNKEIYADKIKYEDAKQIMILADNAKVLSGNRELFGNNINIQFNDSLISSIGIEGNAKAHNIIYALLNKSDTKLQKFVDIMLGNNIKVNFENDEIQNIILDRMASTKYHAIDSTLLIGVNSVDGQVINLNFENDELSTIHAKGDARGTFIPERNNSNIDSTVVYKSEEIDYLLKTQESFLHESGEIQYQNMVLDANYIHVDWENNTLNAIKKSDKLPSVITDNGDPMEGDSLQYNLLDKQGTIYKGKTKIDDAYYHGNQIYRDDPNLYHVTSSEYTSCDLDHPHYSFYSDNMKMIPGDRVIARPLILKIFDFPIMGVPFAVLPNKGGRRHSGWIMPSFGFDDTNGSTMNGLGYYWAPNDYMDSKLIINFADRIGFWVRNTTRYKLRYKIDGSIDIKFVRNLANTKYIESIMTDSTTQDYEINIKHRYTIDPNHSLNIDYKYVSNYNFHNNTGSDPIENLAKQRSVSSLNYSKSWDGGNAISLVANRTIDLKSLEKISLPPTEEGVIFPTNYKAFPSINFAHSTSNLFGEGDRWYQKLLWSFRSSYNSSYRKGKNAISESTNTFVWQDTTEYKNSISNQLSFAYPGKLFDWLNLSTRLNIQEDWIFKYRDFDFDEDFESQDLVFKDGFRRRMTAKASGSLNTKIYGLFPVNINSLEAIRHTIYPSVTMSYIPNITKPIFGYNLNSIFTNAGEWQFDQSGDLYDPFRGSSVSPTSEQEQLVYTFKIQNLFQTKHNKEGVVEKNDILDWEVSTEYDVFADELNWKPIRSKVKSGIPGLSNLNMNFTHDIYEVTSQGRINQYKNQVNGIPIPYLTKFDASTSISLSGKRLIGFETDTLNNKTAILASDNLWTTNLGLSYNKSKILNQNTNELEWKENCQLTTSTKLNLSKKWKLSYNVGFDLINQIMGYQKFNFTRNLHCWEFKFSWIPGRSYFLHIYIKKSDLRDVKIETRSKNERSNFYN